MDPSSDYHFLSDVLGKTVKITLKCGVFQGVLQHVDSNRSIFINRVKNLENGRCVPGVKMFFGHEIVNVQLLDESKKCEAEGMETPTSRENPATRIAAEDKGKPLKQNTQSSNATSQERKQLNLCQFKSTYSDEDTEEAIEYIVIDQFQRKFGSAMMHIKKQNVCAIAAEGVNLCRHGKLSWLQVATKSHVFLFDIFLLGARVFKNGLQMVLEDTNILKVIHDCRWLSDCLSHQYGIMLSNVFDTQVADILSFSMETGGFLPHRICTLQECMRQHLEMPYKQVSFMTRRQHAVERNPEVWFVRPLPPALLNVLALETFYLLPLRMMFLDKIMSDLTTLVDGYLNAFREGSADPLGSTEFSCMELPQELRQLADFHKLRREKALQKFQQNEEGLLIRTPVETVAKKTARKEGNQRDSTGFIPLNRAAFLITSGASTVRFLDPVGQDYSRSAISVSARLYQSSKEQVDTRGVLVGSAWGDEHGARAQGLGRAACQARQKVFCGLGLRAPGGGAEFDYSGLAMAPLLPPAMAPRVPAPLLSVSESGRRRRPSARSRRLLLNSDSAAAILARQKPRGIAAGHRQRHRRRRSSGPAGASERPTRESPSARVAPRTQVRRGPGRCRRGGDPRGTGRRSPPAHLPGSRSSVPGSKAFS
uniref:piRNA biogenesis protein EXD1 n=1 Tax=Euleptes europaea TaxID=460621 RepID=UPI002540F6E5|nr:piRNA biogenesis protein EXD1 [Euleptes europaea]